MHNRKAFWCISWKIKIVTSYKFLKRKLNNTRLLRKEFMLKFQQVPFNEFMLFIFFIMHNHRYFLVLFHPVLNSFMSVQISSLCKRFCASWIRTLVRLFSRMYSNMCFQVKVYRKTLIAIWTFKWLFSCMN